MRWLGRLFETNKVRAFAGAVVLHALALVLISQFTGHHPEVRTADITNISFEDFKISEPIIRSEELPQAEAAETARTATPSRIPPPETDPQNETGETGERTKTIRSDDRRGTPNPEDRLSSDPSGNGFPNKLPETADQQNVIEALKSIRCNRLGQLDPPPECDPWNSEQAGVNMARPEREWVAEELPENPFASAMERFAERQYERNGTSYALTQTQNNDHQHANPFAGSQTSAERDLTGRVNASTDPVWGD